MTTALPATRFDHPPFRHFIVEMVYFVLVMLAGLVLIAGAGDLLSPRVPAALVPYVESIANGAIIAMRILVPPYFLWRVFYRRPGVGTAS